MKENLRRQRSGVGVDKKNRKKINRILFTFELVEIFTPMIRTSLYAKKKGSEVKKKIVNENQQKMRRPPHSHSFHKITIIPA